MVDKELCGTNRHLILKIEPLDGPAPAVTWWSAVKYALAGVAFMAGLSALLFITVGVGPGASVVGVSVALVIVGVAFFLVAGHHFGCAVKKSLAMVFGWWQSI
ncbi:hypothetical protein [Kitasatospora purpeofusca]|uniref:Uncharacterized protein n=1 Tax=Kitasatospora purpeofusca TaxID=67352 RepID=A0ABZ1U6K3_9ACTN|nr:hypothetical protein [Kitasatospora purpeofusca]